MIRAITGNAIAAASQQLTEGGMEVCMYWRYLIHCMLFTACIVTTYDDIGVNGDHNYDN